jgi:hypothetical protein
MVEGISKSEALMDVRTRPGAGSTPTLAEDAERRHEEDVRFGLRSTCPPAWAPEGDAQTIAPVPAGEGCCRWSQIGDSVPG